MHRWVALLVVLAGCASAPGADVHKEQPLPAEVMVADVNITVRIPRSTNQETYVFQVNLTAPNEKEFSGREELHNGPGCGGWCMGQERSTGDFVPRGMENGSPYPYLWTRGVAYQGNWTLGLAKLEENWLGLDEPPPVGPGGGLADCAFFRFVEAGFRPDAGGGSELHDDRGIALCLKPGTYTVHFDGLNATIVG